MPAKVTMPRRPIWRLFTLVSWTLAVVAPFAGIVHVGLALLEQPAMAREGIDGGRIGDARVGALKLDVLAVGPFDLEPFSCEEAFVIGYELGQALERRGGFEHQRLHGKCLHGTVSGCLSRPGGASTAATHELASRIPARMRGGRAKGNHFRQ